MECDAVTHDFRQILIETRVISTASAIDKKAWNELVVGADRKWLGDALDVCVENCLSEAFKIAGDEFERSSGHKLVFVYATMGAIGFLDFSGPLDLNIVIRTIVLTQDRATFGVGGAVVTDSDPHDEYQETQDKAHALIRALATVNATEASHANAYH